MIRCETFYRYILAEKKNRGIGEAKRHKICKEYVQMLVEKGDFDKSIEGPIRYAQGNKDILESLDNEHHTFRLWILSEMLVSLLYFIPAYKGFDILRFKEDVLEESMDILKDGGPTVDMDIAFNNILKMGLGAMDYDGLVRNVSIANHYITGLAVRNISCAGEVTRGINTVIRHLGNK